MQTWSNTAARVLVASVFALMFCASGRNASAASPEFGSPPSGEIPILYNDHTVYATPDILKQGRVLAALVKDGVIYVPLRSMFEQMGAAVSTSADGTTITAAKSGVTVSVTVGKNEVAINGETRPLDVPPMLYKGIVLAPVRVLSEAMGAYVQWVPEKRVVVVRYISGMAPATAAPVATSSPTPSPTPSPSPTPAPPEYRGFIQAAVSAPKNYNEFSAGQYCPRSYLVGAGYVFKDSPFAVKLDYRQDAYVTSDNLTDFAGNHYTQFATIDGGTSFTPVFLANQSSVDARLEFQVAAPRIYVGVGYLQTADNYGYPHLSGFGLGVEKLPDLQSGINLFGSAFYYPSATGTYTVASSASPNAGKSYRQQYQIVKYDIGLALASARFPVYVYGGLSGDRYGAVQNAPIGQAHDGPYLGLGVKL